MGSHFAELIRPVLILDLQGGFGVFTLDRLRFVEHAAQTVGGYDHRSGRVGIHQVAGYDSDAGYLDRDIGPVGHHSVPAPAGRLAATPGREVVTAQLFEIAQPAVGEYTGELVVLDSAQLGTATVGCAGGATSRCRAAVWSWCPTPLDGLPVFGIVGLGPAPRVPQAALIAVGRYTVVDLQHLGEMKQVVGHEGGIAIRKVVFRPARTGIEI